MANLFDYVSGQGRLFIGSRTSAGLLSGTWLWLGDSPNFELGQAVSQQKIKENYTGLRGNAITLNTGVDTSFRFTLRSIEPANFALMTQGAILTTGGVTITTEANFPTLAIGDFHLLSVPGKITALTVIDSAGTPLTLTLGTHYTHDGYGLIKMLALPGTQPYKASTYTVAAKSEVTIQNQTIADKMLRFVGYNTARKTSAGNFARIDLTLYLATLTPAETISFIQPDNIAEPVINGSFDADPTKSTTSTTSQYGVLTYPDGF